MTNQTSNIIKIVVLIFAVLGVAVAAFFIVKKLTERKKALKDDSLFDELDELDIDDECCCCCDDCDDMIEAAAEEI